MNTKIMTLPTNTFVSLLVLFFVHTDYNNDVLFASASSSPSTNSSNPFYTCYDDASWAIRSGQLSSVLGDGKQAFYNEFVESCSQVADATQCNHEETYRFKMNSHQPSSVYNYTKMGFKKIRAPKELYDLVWNFWSKNRDNAVIEWKQINTYHNMWDSPPTIVHINQKNFEGGGAALQDKIWEAIRNVLEEWTGQLLSPVSLYGIRLYHNNSILAPHVDRMPLVVSAILNVDQDVDEPWPLEVYDHDGVAHNVTMEPGDLVLYESHSIIHGRPFPLNGKFFANLFLHFEALGPIMDVLQGQTQAHSDIPPYVIPGSYWADEWRRTNPNGWISTYSNPVTAAQQGDFRALRRLAKMNDAILTVSDPNGWQPLHEAVRAGHSQALRVLYDAGVDLNAKTKYGETPLMLARTYHGEDAQITQMLLRYGAHDSASTGDEL